MWSFDVLSAMLSTASTLNMPQAFQGGSILQGIALPSLGKVGLLLWDGAAAQALLIAVDHTTYPSIPTWTGALLAVGPAIPHRIAVSGETLFAVYQGSASTNAPGRLRALTLPSMNVALDLTFAPGTVKDVIVPGGAFAYVITTTAVVPVHLATGVPHTPIPVGGPGYGTAALWTNGNGVIYVISHSDGPPAIDGINAVDTTTHSALFPAPVPLPSGGHALRHGPGASGDALVLATASSVLQLSTATLAVTGGSTQVANLVDIQLSNGGTQWLLLSTNFIVSQVFTMDPSTLAVSPTTISGSASQLAVIPSASVNVAYLVGKVFPHAIIGFTTDPAIVPFPNPPLISAVGPWTPTFTVVD